MEKKAYSKYILSLILFGTNGIVASGIALSSEEIVLMRTLIGSVLLVCLFKLTKQQIAFYRYRKDCFFVGISGVAMGASWLLLFEAYQQIGVSIATLAYYCGPAIVMILSPLLFKESLTRIKIVGFLAVLGGIFCINQQAAMNGQLNWGLLCGMGSALMYAVMIIFNKKAKQIVGLENAMLQLCISCLTVALFVGIKQGLVINIAGSDWIPILLLGVVNTGLGCYLYFSSIGKLPVQSVAVLGYLDPLVAVVFSTLWLGERMTMLQVIGAILILGGGMVAELFKKKEQKVEELLVEKI